MENSAERSQDSIPSELEKLHMTDSVIVERSDSPKVAIGEEDKHSEPIPQSPGNSSRQSSKEPRSAPDQIHEELFSLNDEELPHVPTPEQHSYILMWVLVPTVIAFLGTLLYVRSR